MFEIECLDQWYDWSVAGRDVRIFLGRNKELTGLEEDVFCAFSFDEAELKVLDLAENESGEGFRGQPYVL